MKDRRVQLPLSLLLLAIAIGGTIDLVLDQPSDWFARRCRENATDPVGDTLNRLDRSE